MKSNYTLPEQAGEMEADIVGFANIRKAPPGSKLIPGHAESVLARELEDVHNTLLELAIQMRGRKADRRVQKSVNKALSNLWRAKIDCEIIANAKREDGDDS